jgi:hypothetical protein
MSVEPKHFLLVKHADHTAAGAPIKALDAAMALLDAEMWPLWVRTPCKDLVQPGDRIAVYLAGSGNQVVVASATVDAKQPWSPSLARQYPLTLSGVPLLALRLGDIHRLAKPVSVVSNLARLEFIGQNKKKWGVRLMGGMRSVSARDYDLLTARP